jgi:protoheme IX farnesyltransferase
MLKSMGRIRDFLSLIKIGIVGSNALTALAGFAMAAAGEGLPFPWSRGAIVLAGASLLVGGSCAINNWLDRDIDARMERTRDRPTARGAMGAAQALGIGIGLGTAGLALLLVLGIVPAALGLAGAIVYIAAYTLWAKRRGASSLYIGGIAGSLPPLIGWAAIDPRLGGPAWLLFAFLAIWQQSHVRALALMRADEYRAAGIPMAGLASMAAARAASAAANGRESERGPRAAVLAWATAALPIPTFAILLAGLPLIKSALAVSALSWALGCAWIAAGLARFRAPAWPRMMFAASLVYLVLVFCGLIAIGA